MNLTHLVLRPRRFFEEQSSSINWVWPAAGFYFFSFASFFQQFVVHEYRIPYWLAIFVVAWAPSFTLVIGLFVSLVLLWYWPASKILGAPQPLARSAQVVGVSLLPPGLLFSASLLVLATAKSNGVAAPYRLIVGGLHAAAGLWALALVVQAAAVSNKFTPRKTALFVAWFAVLVAVVGMLAYTIDHEG